MEEKILKDDIESNTQFSDRLKEGYKTLQKGGTHLVACHAGVVKNALIHVGFNDYMIKNTGIVSFKFDLEKGVPTEVIGFWDPTG